MRPKHAWSKGMLSFIFPLCSFVLASSGPASIQDAQQIYAKCSPAIVKIVTSQDLTGTGFFHNGHLYTCFHVMKGCTSASFSTKDGVKGTVVGIFAADPDKDIAVLKTDKPVAGDLPFADYDAVAVGQPAIVIGNPEGLDSTITSGLVSGKRTDSKEDVLQLSAAVSPGSSGSPVLDNQGRVMGMVTSQLKEGQQLNFAISSKDLRGVEFVPLALAFGGSGNSGAASSSGGVSNSLAQPSIAVLPYPENIKDLIDLGVEDLVGIDSLRILVEDLPEAFSGVFTTDDVKEWAAEKLKDGGLRVPEVKGDVTPAKGLFDSLREGDVGTRHLYINVNGVKLEDGTIAYDVRCTLSRWVIIPPGWFGTADVWDKSTVGIGGSAATTAARVQSIVENQVQALVDKIKLAASKTSQLK